MEKTKVYQVNIIMKWTYSINIYICPGIPGLGAVFLKHKNKVEMKHINC